MGDLVSAEETQRLAGSLEALRKKQAALTSEWEELMVQLEEQSTAS